MDYYFKSKEELFERVKPALNSREKDFRILGYSNIKIIDIWNYLIKYKWKDSKGLTLADIVNDILTVNVEEVNSFLNDD